MSYNGNGVFLINTAGQPVVANTVISATTFNLLTADLANGLTNAITKDGQTTVTANIPMSNFKITGLGAATAANDAVRLEQLTSGATNVSFGNLAYTGTLTGGTGVVNLGSGQVYKDASGNVGIGTSTPGEKLDVVGAIRSTISGKTAQFNAAGGSIYGEFADGTSTWRLGNGIISAGLFSLYNTTTATQAFNVTTSGNVGIGTASPIAKLDVNNLIFVRPTTTAGESQVGSVAFDYSTSFTNTSLVQYGSTATGTTLALSNASLGRLQFINCSAGLIYTNSGPLVFGTQSAERMRIDTSGNLLVGTTAAPSGTVLGAQISSGGVGTFSANSTQSIDVFRLGTTGAMVAFFYGATNVGTITTSGTTTAYNTSSDYRLKENVQPMQGALATVAALKPVTYKWKADGSAGQGFIAHELQAVVPDCVTGEKDAVDKDGKPQYQGVDTSFLVATLVSAIQEQQAIITNLTTRLTALEGN